MNLRYYVEIRLSHRSAGRPLLLAADLIASASTVHRLTPTAATTVFRFVVPLVRIDPFRAIIFYTSKLEQKYFTFYKIGLGVFGNYLVIINYYVNLLL